jgi:hypothetical protein
MAEISVGDVVLYKHPEGAVSPALVKEVAEGGKLRLAVFSNIGVDLDLKDVEAGEGEGQYALRG